MPITVTAPQGVLTPTGEREVLPQLMAALAEITGLKGNTFFTPLIGGTLHLLDGQDVYAGGGNRPVVMVELKLPNIGLATIELRAAFIAEATGIVAALSVDGHDLDDIWVNILNAADGAWGIGGRAYTGDALIAGVTAAQVG